MRLGGRDCIGGGIDAGDPRSTTRHGFRHEAARTAKIQHSARAQAMNLSK
jgi:hypothetical protein